MAVRAGQGLAARGPPDLAGPGDAGGIPDLPDRRSIPHRFGPAAEAGGRLGPVARCSRGLKTAPWGGLKGGLTGARGRRRRLGGPGQGNGRRRPGEGDRVGLGEGPVRLKQVGARSLRRIGRLRTGPAGMPGSFRRHLSGAAGWRRPRGGPRRPLGRCNPGHQGLEAPRLADGRRLAGPSGRRHGGWSRKGGEGRHGGRQQLWLEVRGSAPAAPGSIRPVPSNPWANCQLWPQDVVFLTCFVGFAGVATRRRGSEVAGLARSKRTGRDEFRAGRGHWRQSCDGLQDTAGASEGSP